MIAYWYPTYDTLLRIGAMISLSRPFDSFLEGDPLSNLGWLFNKDIDGIYFCTLYIFLTGLFFYKHMMDFLPDEKMEWFPILLIVFGLTLSNWANLTYSCMATTFSIYAVEKYKHRYILYIPIIFITYCMHPSLLLILPSSLILQFLFQRGWIRMVMIYVIVLFALYYTLFHGYQFLFDIQNAMYESAVNSFENYTSSDSAWGSGGMNVGVRFWLLIVLTIFIGVVALFYAIKKNTLFKNSYSFSMLIVCFILLINVYDYYTLRERTVLAISIAALSLHMQIYRAGLYNLTVKKLLAFGVIGVFVLSHSISPQGPQAVLISSDKGSSVYSSTFYCPSIMALLDMGSFGYNNEYIKKNRKYGR